MSVKKLGQGQQLAFSEENSLAFFLRIKILELWIT